MVVRTDSERVRHSRKLVLELLGSSVDLSLVSSCKRHIANTARGPSALGGAATVRSR